MRFLQDSLDSKQALLGDVPGTGISLRYGTTLRKVYRHGGIAVTHSLNPKDINDPINFKFGYRANSCSRSSQRKRPCRKTSLKGSSTLSAPLPRALS